MPELDGADPAWVQRAQAAYEVLDREAAAGEAAGALTPAAMEAIWECGAMTMGWPRRFGGPDVDGITAMRVFEELARADASASWTMIAAGLTSAWMAAGLPEEGAAEIFDTDPPGVVAGMPQPMGRATRVDGGYQFEGRFQFASGSGFANWFVGGAVVEGTQGENGLPEMVVLVVPEGDGLRAGNWDVLGLRATESIDIEIPRCFVPERRTMPMPHLSPAGNLTWSVIHNSSQVIAVGPCALGALGHGGVILGMARRALEEIAAMAPTRRPMGGPPVSERDVFRYGLVRHDVALRSVRALLYEQIRAMADGGDGTIGDHHLFSTVLYLHDVAYEAIEFAYNWGGTSVIRGSHPLGRAMRDIHAARQHVICDRQRWVDAAPTIMGDLTTTAQTDDDLAAAR
jgi:alkylation response protein AidB-like acyl-CoA dehydrogenase